MKGGAYPFPFPASHLSTVKKANTETSVALNSVLLRTHARLWAYTLLVDNLSSRISLTQSVFQYEKVGRKTLRNRHNQVPDLIQYNSWEKGQHKETSIKTSQATVRRIAISHTGGHRLVYHLTSIFTYFYIYIYISRITINNDTPHLKSPKSQNRGGRLGTASNKIAGGGALTSLRWTNPRP